MYKMVLAGIGFSGAAVIVAALAQEHGAFLSAFAGEISGAIGTALESEPLVIENPQANAPLALASVVATQIHTEENAEPVQKSNTSVAPKITAVPAPPVVVATPPPSAPLAPRSPTLSGNPIYDPIPVPVSPGFGASGGGGGSTTLTTSGISTPSTPADTTAPDISLSVSACDASLASDGCLLLASPASASWLSSASDLASFTLQVGEAFSITTATSTSLTLANGTHTIAVSSVDESNNRSATSTQTVVISTQPAVLNELSYFGTEASGSDEWVELYNRTSSTITLDGWTLHTADGSPYIPLSGSISSGGYYLIERKNDGETDEATESPIANVTADLWTSFGSGLSDFGEHLYLSYFSSTATTTIDELDFSLCGLWCGIGGGSNYLSMERKAPDISGLTDSGWTPNRGDRTNIKNGLDQAGNSIRGTPRARNYGNYLVNFGSNLTSGTLSLVATGSPYFIDNQQFTISNGATLTSTGATIKFLGNAGITNNGALTATNSTLTSYSDDTTADGDFNRDGSSSSPQAGDWFGIDYQSGSAGSITNSIIRYGGKFTGVLGNKANIYITNSSPAITNSTIEYGRTYGIYLDTSSSTISNNTIRYQTTDTPAYGVYGSGGAPTITNNTIASNSYGMAFWDSTGTFSSNTFTNNTNGAFTWAGGLTGAGRIQGNTGSGNGTWNGIRLNGGNLLSAGATSTFSANTLFPYILPSTSEVPTGAGLIAEAGSVWKFAGVSFNIYGRIEAQGTPSSPVLFTHWLSDSDGSDVHGNGSTTPTTLFPSGIYLKPNATSDFTNSTISYLDNGLNYDSSTISLENVLFSHNLQAISAPAGTPVTKAINVSFEGNVGTSTVVLD